MEKQPRSYRNKNRTRAERKQMTDYLNSLTSVTGEQWDARLSLIHESIRSEVAKVIWWDFYGYKMNLKAPRNLDEHMYTPYVDVEKKLMVDALVKCGYSQLHAERRIGNSFHKKALI